MKIYCFDIDGTICDTLNGDYEGTKPMQERIDVVNRLYDEGNYIKLLTARGQGTGLNQKDLTARQLKEWGVKYHELDMTKPFADVYIDDRAINDKDFFHDR